MHGKRLIGDTLEKSLTNILLFLFLLLMSTLCLADEVSSKISVDQRMAAEIDSDDEIPTRTIILADLYYENGLHVVFSYSAESEEFSLLQQGSIGVAELVTGEVESLLELYLTVTPNYLPVPELLLKEKNESQILVESHSRSTTTHVVRASPLSLASVSATASAAVSSACFNPYYSWWNWFDPAESGMLPKTYGSSSFGGKKRYTDSYIVNCTPAEWGDWLWARHRIYYKNVWGNYKKQHEGKVKPGHWERKHMGSVKRYRKVIYDDGWGSSAACGSFDGDPLTQCRYKREGRFHN